MHVALLQMDLAWQDAFANRAEVDRLILGAGLPSGSLVLAPEMTDTGFVPRMAEGAAEDGSAFAAAVAQRHRVWYQHGCTVRATDGFGRNQAVIAAPNGCIAAVYSKIHPFGYGSETEGFRGGSDITLASIAGTIVCPFICYDLRFPEVWRLAALAGTEVFTIGASWPEPRHAHWRALCIARAIENQAFVVACNRVGRDPTHAYAGGSMVISPQGEVLAEGDSASCVLRAELDLDALRAWRERFPALRDLRRRFLGRARVLVGETLRDETNEVPRQGH